jgi:CO/xanthine dehydrogenase Mo-binding subunit
MAQTCAYMLKVPLERVSVKFNSTHVIQNGIPTGGSIASELFSLVN